MTLSRATNVAFLGGGRRSAHTTHPSASSFFRGEFSCATDSSRDGEFWIGNGLLFFVLCTHKTHKKAQSAKKGPKKRRPKKKRTTTTGVGPRSECSTHNTFIIIMPRRRTQTPTFRANLMGEYVVLRVDRDENNKMVPKLDAFYGSKTRRF